MSIKFNFNLLEKMVVLVVHVGQQLAQCPPLHRRLKGPQAAANDRTGFLDVHQRFSCTALEDCLGSKKTKWGRFQCRVCVCGGGCTCACAPSNPRVLQLHLLSSFFISALLQGFFLHGSSFHLELSANPFTAMIRNVYRFGSETGKRQQGSALRPAVQSCNQCRASAQMIISSSALPV